MYIGAFKVFDTLPEEIKQTLYVPNRQWSLAMEKGWSVKDIPPFIPLFWELHGKVYVARNALPDYDDGTPLVDGRAYGTKVRFPRENIKLYPFQVPAVRALEKTMDGILEAPCGSGKTVIALAAASRVGVTTLVLVHKEFLMEQWAARIREFLGEEPGMVQGNRCEYKDKKIVVAMIQSILARQYPEDFYYWPGLVISDEVHRLSAPQWSKVIVQFPAARRWGLTATVKRPDGLEPVFMAHIGPVVYSVSPDVRKRTPTIYAVDFFYDVPSSQYRNPYNGDVSIPRLQTALSRHKDRNLQILRYIVHLAKKGRTILVLSSRVDQLKWFYKVLKTYQDKLGFVPYLYIGETSEEERREAEEQADILLATEQLAKEGLDIPRLDTLVWATPVSSEVTLEQAAGRILRDYPEKKDPIILDFVDMSIPVATRLWYKRERIYTALSYEVKRMVAAEPEHSSVGQ